jgi:pimeloyl-ACP methyl ester carboxylesterase
VGVPLAYGWADPVPGVTERIVEVEAADGVVLPGCLLAPGEQQASVCVMWLPGFGMSYDYAPYLAIGRRLASVGIAFASAAVRGHHGAVTAWRHDGGRLRTVKAGSWYEVFAETSLDAAAWLAAARAAGYQSVVLAGHSFGGVKALYFLARQAGVVDGLVLASPSLGLRRLRQETLNLARGLVDQGSGETLLPAGSWPGFGTDTVSAQTYLSWAEVARLIFDPDATWPVSVRCPVFAFYGKKDVGAEPELEFFTGRMSGASVSTTLFDGVSHHYTGGEAVIADAVSAWIRASDLGWRG